MLDLPGILYQWKWRKRSSRAFADRSKYGCAVIFLLTFLIQIDTTQPGTTVFIAIDWHSIILALENSSSAP